LQTLYPSPFSKFQKKTNEVPVESTPFAIKTLAPIIAANLILKKEIEALRKRESK